MVTGSSSVYYLSPNMAAGLTWYDAYNSCVDMGAHLIAVDQIEEHDYFKQLFTTLSESIF